MPTQKKKEAAEPTAQTETSSLTHLTAPAASSPPPHPNPPPTHIPTLPLPAAAPLSEMGGGGGVVLGTPHRPPPPPTMSGWHPPPSNPPHRKGIGRREGAYARVCRRSQTELPISSVSQQRPRGGPDTCVTNPTHPPRGPTEDGGHEAPPRGPMEDGGLEPKCV